VNDPQRHSPEPWKIIEPIGIFGVEIWKADGSQSICGDFIHDPDSYRIVECVNACAAIPNPEGIPALVEAAREAVKKCARCQGRGYVRECKGLSDVVGKLWPCSGCGPYVAALAKTGLKP